ncbi:MAG: DNA repair protein RecO [Clostridiaceae bacterium]|nr:DNA repair protein RecO [Clostridiaceae bacterium]
MAIKIKGLIIKETKVGEGDKIITMLTSELGIIQAAAKGARSYKSKFLAGCQLFCYTAFDLREKTKLFSVVSAEPIHTFYEIRNDFERLSLAVYFCDLLNEIGTDLHNADTMLSLALNTLYLLSKSTNLTQLKATFELRLICETGFAPELYSCVKCGNKSDNNFISTQDGGMLCNTCSSQTNILPGTLSAMRHIISAPLKKTFSYHTDNKVLLELKTITENYLLYQIDKFPRSLKYYHRLTKSRE